MLELTGRQVRLQSQQRAQSSCLWLRRRSAVKRRTARLLLCTSYRIEDQDAVPAEQDVGPPRSRLLVDRTRPAQQKPPSPRGRLIRRTEQPPAPKREAPQTSGRLLQRSEPITRTANGLKRATDTLRKTKQNASAAKTQHSDAKPQQSERRNASTNTRFSQEAGKLSQKDWQVSGRHGCSQLLCCLTNAAY